MPARAILVNLVARLSERKALCSLSPDAEHVVLLVFERIFPFVPYLRANRIRNVLDEVINNPSY